MDLATLRKKIDTLDKHIVQLLNDRANLTVDVGRIKHQTGKNIYCPDREREVLRKISSLNTGPLKQTALEAIYREIMSSSLALEKPLTIAYLGPQATFTHLASLKKFGSQVTYCPCQSIGDVFLEVERGNADYGVVPIENSIEGAISHTLDMFVESDLKICAQIILEISHNLLSLRQLTSIKRIYSNPHVFGQCRLWLQAHVPKAEFVEVSSTTKAAQIAATEKGSACIASLLASQMYKLPVLAEHIEDSPHNATRFLVIGTTDVPVTKHDKTSILFSVKDKVGALHDILVPFKKYKINLTKIESRPSKKKAWEYNFYVDMNGHRLDQNVANALAALEEHCRFLKILGSYPV